MDVPTSNQCSEVTINLVERNCLVHRDFIGPVWRYVVLLSLSMENP